MIIEPIGEQQQAQVRDATLACLHGAGKHLDPGQKAVLEAAKTELRKLYNRI